MYSFNFDYIFNAVYNLFLAIRYAILFWVLRINPADYLSDHQNDSWDGLRDRGWIKISEPNIIDPNQNTIYLGGDSGVSSLSWWDNIKLHIFHIGNNNVGSISSSGKDSYGFNPDDVNYAINKTNSDPWFSHLKFSIQNPILSFFVDILSVLAFFVLLILIYSMLKWLFLTIGPTLKSKEEAKDKKKKEKREEISEERLKERIKILELEKLKAEKEYNEIENSSFLEENLDINRESDILVMYDKEQNLENSMPAGIAGLPIDENDLSGIEKVEIKKDRDLLLDYKTKNILKEKENKFIKLKNENDNLLKNKEKNIKEIENEINDIYLSKENINKDIDEENLSKEDKEKILLEKEKIDSYKNRWDIVIGYMEGKEEAVWRIGILEADNLLDELLSDRGYIGLTLSDKLKQADFNTIDLAWSAHKIRNRIAHDGSRFVLTDRMARNTLELYRAIFKEFKIFD